MNPKPLSLHLASSPEGEGHALSVALTVIGRDPTADLVLDVPTVSRRHAQVVIERGEAWIEDLGSVPGVRVNGVRVSRALLEPGFKIRLGNAELRVGPHSDQTGELDSVRAPATPTVLALLRSFDPRAPRSTSLAHLLDLVLESLGGERALLFERDGSTPGVSRRLERRRGEARGSLPISMTLVLDALRDGRARLHLQLDAATATPGPESLARLAAGDVRSVVICPLKVLDRIVGVIYVDSRVELREFGPDDMKLLEAVAAAVAGLLDGLKIRDELTSQNSRLWSMLDESAGPPLDQLAAPDSAFRPVLSLADRASRTDASVLVNGETGTGKEVVARHIHRLSGRSRGPFVAVNCGALPEGLLEAELFGHRKGAFTGALEHRTGLIEQASEGTLFLDEIGELPLVGQVKLLRVLQERVVTRVGESQPRSVDFRLIAATNRSLEDLIREGLFRQDLFYRLNVFKVELPPLRTRTGDIRLISEHLLGRITHRMGSQVRGIAPDALAALCRYAWPGNIRELANTLERAVAMEESELLTVSALPPEISGGPEACEGQPAHAPVPHEDLPGGAAGEVAPHPPLPYAEAHQEFERVYFEQLLRSDGPSIAAMARRARVTRLTVYRRLEEHGLKRT